LRLEHQFISVVVDKGNIVSHLSQLTDTLVVVENFPFVFSRNVILEEVACDKDAGKEGEDDKLFTQFVVFLQQYVEFPGLFC
jgi:hypothetical protein